MEAAKPLNYAPRPPSSRRVRRLTYRIFAILLFSTAAVFLVRTGWNDLTQLFWQRRCLVFLQPPDHVVLEKNHGIWIHQELCIPEDHYFRKPTSQCEGTIFIHELRQPDGTRRLVTLSLGTWLAPYAIGTFFVTRESFDLEYSVSDVALFPKPAVEENISVACHGAMPNNHWKFFAGQPDPNNPTHFTFDYELEGTQHTCDAWLHNDGKLVISQRP